MSLQTLVLSDREVEGEGPRRLISFTLLLAVVLAPQTARAQFSKYPPVIVDAGLQNSPLVHAGYLDATLYGANPDGGTDSTNAIQAAIADGIAYALTTYLPVPPGTPGIYRVSDTLSGIADNYNVSVGTEAEFPRTPSLVGPASGPRPVLRLADNAVGFGSATQTKPVVFFQLELPDGGLAWQQTQQNFFNSVIRDLDLQLGSGNAGAIGIQFSAAQGSVLENVSVDATGAYAGINGVPETESVVNLQVQGGQYGIIPTTCCGLSLVGITLSNQIIAGLKLGSYGSTMVTGFDIRETAPAVAAINGGSGQTDELALLDGTITITGSGGGPAIANDGGLDLYLRNIYVSTPGALVQSGSAPPVAGSGQQDLIQEYLYTNAVAATQDGNTMNSFTLIDGGIGQADFATILLAIGSAPPTDLVLRHLPGQAPWFLDPGVVDVTAAPYGADPLGNADSTAAIQNAIAASAGNGEEVFLPRGDYNLSGTITLNPATRLFGQPGFRSRLNAPAWDAGGVFQPYLRSASTVDGATRLDDIWITLPATDTDAGYAQTYLSGLDWRAGRSSIVRQVYLLIGYVQDYKSSAARKLVEIEGNGGGRWYGLQLSELAHETRNANSDFRFLLDTGTTAALTFYGANPEHAEDDPGVEINGSSNVRFLGSKTEGMSFAFIDSHNAMFAGHTANGSDPPEVLVLRSTDVVAPLTGLFFGQGYAANLSLQEVSASGADAGISSLDYVSFFGNGSFDDSQFPHCGDGVCDGAETAANCAADCGGATSTTSSSSSTASSSGAASSSSTGAGGTSAGPSSTGTGSTSGAGTSVATSTSGTSGSTTSGGTGSGMHASGGCGCGDVGDSSVMGLVFLSVLARRRASRAV